jgi:hypothetical protein
MVQQCMLCANNETEGPTCKTLASTHASNTANRTATLVQSATRSSRVIEGLRAQLFTMTNPYMLQCVVFCHIQ